MFEIDRRSPLPLYFQLKQLLIQNIQQGVWKPGEQLPTEEEIQQDYEISRTTVRQALRELELEGRISRQPGRGTFVTSPKLREGTEPFNITVSEYLEPGVQLSWSILSAQWDNLPFQFAAQLQISPEDKVFCLRRLRLSNNDVIGIATSYIPKVYADQVDLSLAEQGGSMNYLTGVDLELCDAERIIEALPAGQKDAELLGIENHDPVLVISRLLHSCDGRPIEFFRGVYRGDRFQYHVQSLPART